MLYEVITEEQTGSFEYGEQHDEHYRCYKRQFYGGGVKQLGVQLVGAGTAFVWAFGLGLGMFFRNNFV